MEVKLIVCLNNTLSIGNGNALIYHISDDIKHFKKLTSNNIVVMGRKTYESLPIKPLPNRVNIVVTSDANFKADGCIILSSVKEVISFYKTLNTDKILYVIGGGQLYKSFLDEDLIDTMEITMVVDDFEGNIKFPNVLNDNEKWEIINKSDDMIDSKSGLHYVFLTYSRRNKIIE